MWINEETGEFGILDDRCVKKYGIVKPILTEDGKPALHISGFIIEKPWYVKPIRFDLLKRRIRNVLRRKKT